VQEREDARRQGRVEPHGPADGAVDDLPVGRLDPMLVELGINPRTVKYVTLGTQWIQAVAQKRAEKMALRAEFALSFVGEAPALCELLETSDNDLTKQTIFGSLGKIGNKEDQTVATLSRVTQGNHSWPVRQAALTTQLELFDDVERRVELCREAETEVLNNWGGGLLPLYLQIANNLYHNYYHVGGDELRDHAKRVAGQLVRPDGPDLGHQANLNLRG
jgi:hypothetical protein